ncbi:hypothetical protein QJS66_17350 [Kocuria rhizophila]|nr:hypothetical protein QJS66_17350 [Kocuria rhizophila]
MHGNPGRGTAHRRLPFSKRRPGQDLPAGATPVDALARAWTWRWGGKGESVAVVASPVGKSTLMHLLALLDRPHARRGGAGGPRAISAPRSFNELRNSALAVPAVLLIANQSVLENVTLPLKIAGVPACERDAGTGGAGAAGDGGGPGGQQGHRSLRRPGGGAW